MPRQTAAGAPGAAIPAGGRHPVGLNCAERLCGRPAGAVPPPWWRGFALVVWGLLIDKNKKNIILILLD